MQTIDLSRARSHSYALFGRLFLEGVTEETLPIVQALPLLAEQLPHPFDFDQAAAAHYALFRQSVLPYATIFVDQTGLLGGAVSNRTRQAYEQLGYQPAAGHSPDHLGEMLLFLSFLAGEETDCAPSERPFWQAQQLAFLQNHLLPWLPVLHVALQHDQAPFFSTVSEMLMTLLVDHLEMLGVKTQELLPMRATPALDLADERTGLRQISAFLTSPPQSGVYLSRTVLARMARGASLPRGFGKRADLLQNLLRSAAQYDEVEKVVGEITAVCETWGEAYAQLIAEDACLAPYLNPWQARLRNTLILLGQIKTLSSE